MSLEVDPSFEASSGRIRTSFGLSDKELIKCAFSHPQTEGATESPDINGEHFYTYNFLFFPKKKKIVFDF